MGVAILLGFIVYIVISLVVLAIVVKVASGKKWKWISGLLVVLMSILIPTWDIPIGRINFYQLCKSQAGQFIYKEVPLSDEYFLKAGERDLRYQHDINPNAFAKGGELNLERVKQDYLINGIYDKEFSRWGHIYKLETTISSIQDNQTLSRAVTFFYGGGWLTASFKGGGSIYCPENELTGSRYHIHETIIDKTFHEDKTR